MNFPLPPNEAVILSEFFRLLDAREVAAIEPRPDTVGELSEPLDGLAPAVREVGAAHTLPLFPNEEAA